MGSIDVVALVRLELYKDSTKVKKGYLVELRPFNPLICTQKIVVMDFFQDFESDR